MAGGCPVAQVIEALAGGGGVPGFAVVEGYAFTEGEAPAVGAVVGPAGHGGQGHQFKGCAVDPGEGIGGDFLADGGGDAAAATWVPGAEGVGFRLSNENDLVGGG